MGQIVSWSVRDESLHCEGITRLFHAFVQERGCLTKSVKEDILDMCMKTVRLEDAFIDLAFEQGPVPGMTAGEIKDYIRYIADWRLGQLGLQPQFRVKDHPLPWLAPLLNGVEHANFFETRATEYSKAATRGNWNEVWASFDSRGKAKQSAAANEADEGDGPGLFGDAGGAQAAE
jgi:ribonucleoside-diphosphate reductase beta chain